ncbi:uncharacterized protein LOC118426520 [Branchiostoma floridae]|uniref:Uncharacterized protein LOC118426520 n=1 Tax=Branchiostoma floridae TaxID=7739 RepID=C3YCP2_BRAFL|nr:uncharacterized protein LOC118426520 [Branchiostoma floridae]|eukprot:XP_002605833.1 hypothetical protein BRAFLDRAFT_84318 [Branchiostoma floridae]
MAGPAREGVSVADIRHLDFRATLLGISDELTDEETANLKLFCSHLIPKGQLANLGRAADVFDRLKQLDKIDQENLGFVKEILERMGRQDLIKDVLWQFEQPGRELPERVSDVDRRHFDFVHVLLRLSDGLTDEETANFKYFCLDFVPIPARGQLAQLRRAIDVFYKLRELDKMDQENLDLVEEILERMGRRDLIRNVLRPFQPPDREIPENPDLQPGTSDGSVNTDGTADVMSNIYVVVQGQVRMVQEYLDRLRNSLASLCRTRKSQLMYRRYRRDRSVLVHFSIPRENTAVLRLMADYSDPRLVYMGIKSLQIDAEPPITITQEAMLFDVKRQYPADDIDVGCSTRMTLQRAPRNWTRLSALNLFSDALPLHLQVAESLEYQGFSYSLVQSMVQRDQRREHELRQLVQNLLKKIEGIEENSNTLMTMRSMLNIEENRSKDALETIRVLEEKLQQAQNYAEKAAKQVSSHVYRGEKPPGGWPTQVGKAATKKAETMKGVKSEALNFRSPRGVLVLMSPSNEMFVIDKVNKRVQVHNTEGVYLRSFPMVVPDTDEKAMTPHDVSMDANGTLWVVGEGKFADYIVQYSKVGSAMEKFELPETLYLRGIVVDTRNDNILVTEPGGDSGEVQVIRPDGSLVTRFGHPDMRVPDYITVNEEGNILVSDWSTRSLYLYDESGKFLRTEVW